MRGLDHQDDQENYLEVWVEKDALSGVLSRVTKPYHVPIVVNKGYGSLSAMHDAHLRFEDHCCLVTVLYLGDYDPSGLDMIRDIKDRIREFDGGYEFEIIPLALTMEQIKQYNPPPNPAKRQDPRARGFIKKHGSQSWEVDALRPEVLNQLLGDAIGLRIDQVQYSFVQECEVEERGRLHAIKKLL